VKELIIYKRNEINITVTSKWHHISVEVPSLTLEYQICMEIPSVHNLLVSRCKLWNFQSSWRQYVLLFVSCVLYAMEHYGHGIRLMLISAKDVNGISNAMIFSSKNKLSMYVCFLFSCFNI